MQGQELALNLWRAGIDTTLVPESAVYALMARVNKVILGCGGVLANGGIVGQSGALMLASDYVPPRFVSTFVTNAGGNSPSCIYRLLEECYCEEDLSFEE